MPEQERNRVKKEVGDFLVNEILLHVGGGESPVRGEGAFKTLDGDYAKAEKGGNTTPNLDLEGDMLDALGYKVTGEGLEIGILDENQWGKADGHNKFGRKNNNKIPKRRFIPTKSGNFTKEIMSGVRQIIKENSKNRQPEPNENILISEQGTGVDLEAVLGKSFVDELLDF